MRKPLILVLFFIAALLVACGDDSKSDTTADTSGAADTTSVTDTSVTDTSVTGDTSQGDTAVSDTSGADTVDAGDTTPPPDDRMLCVGVRGNGELIFAHFAALSRIVEHHGLIDGVAGGSSGSITSFILESMQMNPSVHDCDGAPCTAAQETERVALLLKSMQGYALVLAGSEEAIAFQQLTPIIARALEDGIDALFDGGNVSAGRDALVALFESEDLVNLINPDVIDLLKNSPDTLYHAQEMYGALTNFGSFDAEDDRILIRPGILNFDAFAALVGRIGSFYAGYAPADQADMADFMSRCASASRGLSWAEASVLDAGDGTTCGELFNTMALDFRAALLADEASFSSRIDDNIGGQDMSVLISTSVLIDSALVSLQDARQDYLAAQPYTLTIDFGDVRFGYWGALDDLVTVEANPQGYTDLKTSKFLSLGQDTWRKALSLSPAEPGLARVLPIDSLRASAGGWSDLHPSLVLKNLGCDDVIYLTRKGEESGFATAVATLLGMDAAGLSALYDLSNPESSFSLSIAEADGVWCTDWNSFGALDVMEISADAYSAPFFTDAASFTTGENPYENITTTPATTGCSF